MSATRAHRFSLFAGLLLLGIAAFGATQPAMTTCGGLEPGYPPLLAFEFARTVHDLHAVFGDPPDDCRAALVQAMDRVNWADSLVFIPAYGAFLLFFLFALGAQKPRLVRLAIAVALIACLADYAENASLLHLTDQLDKPSLWLHLLPWATGVKWLSLGALGVLGGWLLTEHRGFQLFFAALGAVGLAIIVAALANPFAFGRHASAGVAISWVLFLLADVFAILRPRS